MNRLFFLVAALFSSLVVPAPDALANSFDYVGTHKLSVNTVSPIAHTSLPFSSSATGTGPGGFKPFGEFSGEQANPFQLHLVGTLANGAYASTDSTLSFLLDAPTVVSMSGWTTLFHGDGGGLATFDARVTSYAPLTNELIFFTTTAGTWTFDQSVLLQPGWYTFSYLSFAPQAGDRASYEILLTIPEPGTTLLLGLGLAMLGWRAKRDPLPSEQLVDL